MSTNPHIYVDASHGTNTGASDTSFASAQTGTMASIAAASVYDNIFNAIQGVVTFNPGDTIYVSDTHASTSTPTQNAKLHSDSQPDLSPLRVISVDAGDVTLYKPGAVETLGGTLFYWTVEGNVGILGVQLKTGTTVMASSNSGVSLLMQDTTIQMTSTNSTKYPLNLQNDNCYARLINVDVDSPAIGSYVFRLYNGAKLEWLGGTFSGVAPTTRGLVSHAAGSGSLFYAQGVDLSGMGAAPLASSILEFEDRVELLLENCLMSSSLPDVDLSGGSMSQTIQMYGCDDSTSNKLHRFHYQSGTGLATNNDTVYVTNSESWYGGTDKSSIEVETGSKASRTTPFMLKLPSQYVDLASASSNLITLNLVVDTTVGTLTDTDIAVFLCYADGTTAVVPIWMTSSSSTVGAGNYGTDPLAAGTTLSTSALGAADWTGEPASSNFYKIELDTSTTAGQACVVTPRIEIYKPSIAAGKLFFDTELVVS